jgi:hypothetical protein
MRTKTLLVTAVLGAASVAVAVAQTVYSVNAVGFVNKTIPAGQFVLVANPLDAGTDNNTITKLFPDVPNNTTKIWTFDAATSSYSSFTKRSTGWAPNGNTVLAPGTGFFIQNTATTDFTVTFVGEVMQGDLSTPFVAGFNLLGSQVPQAGKVETDLKLPAVLNDKVWTFNAGVYTTLTRRATAWTPSEPTVQVGEAFFFERKGGAAGNWTRSFSVNQ